MAPKRVVRGRVYVYTDESGNTGNNLFDLNQPELWTCSLISNKKIDALARGTVERWRRSVHPDKLHATSLRFFGIEKVADDFCDLISRLNITFYFVQINKSFHAALKFFDTVFDSGINENMDPVGYQMRAVRMSLVQIVIANIDTGHRKLFWDALLNCDPKPFLVVIDHVKSNIRRSAPNEIKNILIPALDWADANPLPLIDDRDRKAHSPNYVAFTKVLFHLHERISSRRRLVEFVHHQQEQYDSKMQWAYNILSKIRVSDSLFSMLPIVDELKNFPSKVEFKSLDDSPGLTLVDIALWLFKRVHDCPVDRFPGCAALGQKIRQLAEIERFTPEGLASEVDGINGC